MSRSGLTLRSRVVQAILGTALVVILGSGWTVLSALTSTSPSSSALTTDGTSQQAPVSPTATDTPVQPTATPTHRARPTATPTKSSNGSTVNLRGTVQQVGQSDFTMSSGGVVDTIQVDANTTYGGQAHKLSDLQHGWQASVTATLVQSGVYLASHVFIDN